MPWWMIAAVCGTCFGMGKTVKPGTDGHPSSCSECGGSGQVSG